MLSAQCKGSDVLAWDVTKEDAPFYCPACKAEVVVKKGRVKVHHFAHIPPTNCVYGSGESEQHRNAKVAIYNALSTHPDVTKLKLERYLQDVRPDISFFFKDTPVAVEVQISTLPLNEIDRRTRSYTNKGIYLLWISPYEKSLQSGEKYSPRQWEKYIHAMYFGKVYYWLAGETLLPIHFDEHMLHVEYTEWYIPGGDGDMDSAGGYDRYSKRYRTPRHLEPVTITSLSPTIRQAWKSSTLSVPAAKLWARR
jgi:competence protein CoiA